MTPVFGLLNMPHCNVISQNFGDPLVFSPRKISIFTFLRFSIMKGSHELFVSVGFAFVGLV